MSIQDSIDYLQEVIQEANILTQQVNSEIEILDLQIEVEKEEQLKEELRKKKKKERIQKEQEEKEAKENQRKQREKQEQEEWNEKQRQIREEEDFQRFCGIFFITIIIACSIVLCCVCRNRIEYF
ncbi:hypothetical protein PPERSA_12691 [Pseudocohnilembus persalinus]|uniref:Uncharacterized protein n=1 Tax=Pseudocohnilembus persalinus TaxID=266149 RepID=A0A0V0QT13_PSEPJ|nr:hypothetical protein PPERSA_12691 [Pseudocohnilembus persalinus]|eukprot:KRX05513.1 hypothetical protein PPERSA_12691 [Pseudocohnilembus persalinus]